MKNYNFKKYNKKIYNKWIYYKYFNSNYNKDKKSYSLLLPPPNITGDLHIGHILNFTILDIYARIKRMKGYNVCWIPGTDHASIATVIKVLKELRKNGINVNNISKKQLKTFLFNWSIKYNKIIIDQLKSIGCSCDWDKFQFTLDKKNYNSVIKVFIYLYKKGLIYKKDRIINWDIVAKTTISDEEVIYKKQINYLYYIKYFTEDKKNFLVIATTRPETIFGDTAICINPKDKRYINFINKKVLVPIVNRLIPIITDKSVNINIGTGCLKITPAHSKKDFKIYKKNKKKIKIINIFNDDGTLNVNYKHYKGEDRFIVRKKIYKKLKKLGYLIKKEKIINKIGYSERSNTIIENKLSLQWYLKMKRFIKPTLKIIKRIKIFPKKKYINLFYKWIKNLKDWNISRQLIWGHKIPIYYYKKNVIIATSYKNAIKEIKKKYKKKIKKYDLKRDNNVLDTWFSSWILPIAVLNGINKKNNLFFNYYYPINLLVTGYDILFFWVLRMIMFSSFYIKKEPFKNIYFTGIARDNNKKKLSKSLGNYKNLYYLLNKYGADGVRIGILNNNYENDFIFNENLCLKGRNFINKIWNSFKVINKIKNLKTKYNKIKIEYRLIIKWFENLLNYNLYKLNFLLKNYKIYKSLIFIQKFFKNKFCSIYLEVIKHNKNYINNIIKKKTLDFYYILLKILHPYIPFITEYIWNIFKTKNNNNITISSLPKIKFFNKKIIKKFNYTFTFIKKLKKINLLKKNKKIFIYIKKNNFYKFRKDIYIPLLYKLSYIKEIRIKKKIINKSKYLFFCYKQHKFFLLKKYILLNKKIDNPKYIYKKINFYKNYLLNINNKLKNKKFILLAPKDVIMLEKKKKKDIEMKIFNLKKSLLN
ncbi:MAG: valine--tRNA ligase [Candidatus Shikimatogenerans bostrichidophilus]|nr:MAG: valine--tRNA ligase [Candidatus Shikimatogenerans bostrichidophilus]